ncbi:MAG: hypothetical protein QNK37_38230 [Acidobacteriota bacterium]|nr:hypothetical protein [Acidobacteriota bacterium]
MRLALILFAMTFVGCATVNKRTYTVARDTAVFAAEQHVIITFHNHGTNKAAETLDDWHLVFTAVQAARVEPYGADKWAPVKAAIMRLTNDLKDIKDESVRKTLETLARALDVGASFLSGHEFKLPHENNYEAWKREMRDQLRNLFDQKGGNHATL